MKNQLIFPMAFYVLYMWCLTVYMFRIRVRALKAGQVSAKYFKAYLGELPPDQAVVVGRHYDNQFQLPILFLVTCVACMAINSMTSTTLAIAWIFVVSRIFHSWIHLGSNRLQRRVAAFAMGWIAVLLMWAQLVYSAFQ